MTLVAPSTHTLYLAGPMRGYPAFNFAAFDRARQALRLRGYAVICPAELDREHGFDEHVDEFTEAFGVEVARRDLKAVLLADAVAVLRGFTGSAGARVELTAARWLGLPVVSADEPSVVLTGGVDAWLAGGITPDLLAYEQGTSTPKGRPVIIERPAAAQAAFDRVVYRDPMHDDDPAPSRSTLVEDAILRDLAGIDEAVELDVEECPECASLPRPGCDCEWCVEVSADMAQLELDENPPDKVENGAPVSRRRAMLDEAAELVDGSRNVSYGDPSADFRRTAGLWTTYLDGKTELDPHDVAAMMALLKLSRIRWSPEKRDSWVDLAGYAACGLDTIPDGWQT